jgi:hypothetical protein
MSHFFPKPSTQYNVNNNILTASSVDERQHSGSGRVLLKCSVHRRNHSGCQIKKDGSGEASGACGRKGKCIQVEDLKGRNHFGDRDVDGSII